MGTRVRACAPGGREFTYAAEFIGEKQPEPGWAVSKTYVPKQIYAKWGSS